MNEPLTLESLRRIKRPNTIEDWIAGDSDAAEVLEKARERVNKMQTMTDAAERNTLIDAEALARVYARLQEAKDEYRAILDENRDSLIHVKFQAIGSRRYDDLIELHTMNEVRRKQYLKENPTVKEDQLPVWDPETFTTAIIAHSAVEPALTVEEWEEWLKDDSWNGAELSHLFALAFGVNNVRRVVSLGKELSEIQNL